MIAACLVFAVAGGCETGPVMGEVSGAVTVDGQAPGIGWSITFFPAGEQGQTAGGEVSDGRYTARLPVGSYKVQIRAPRPAGRGTGGNVAGPGLAGPGASDSGAIEESLPAKFHDETELTFEVKPGKSEKNWDLLTK
jgi:hypothetical protein